MSQGKRYYWLKLKEDFFGSKRIKKLRKMAGGDTYLIIYLKLQLKAMKTDGLITFDRIEDNLADELALDLDENPDDVRATLVYLTSCGLAECSDDVTIFFPYAIENVGSESSSAQRVRDYRDKAKALHCNTNVTQVKQICNGEIEIEKEIDIELEREKESPERFRTPTLDEVRSYCEERKNSVDPERFIDYYTSNGWKVGRSKMKDWKAAVRSWERNSIDKKTANDGASYDIGKAVKQAEDHIPTVKKKGARR